MPPKRATPSQRRLQRVGQDDGSQDLEAQLLAVSPIPGHRWRPSVRANRKRPVLSSAGKTIMAAGGPAATASGLGFTGTQAELLVVRCGLSTDEELQELGILALGLWCERHAMHADVVRHGGLRPLTIAIGFPAPPSRPTPSGHRRSARALANLSVHRAYGLLLVEQGAVPVRGHRGGGRRCFSLLLLPLVAAVRSAGAARALRNAFVLRRHRFVVGDRRRPTQCE